AHAGERRGYLARGFRQDAPSGGASADLDLLEVRPEERLPPDDHSRGTVARIFTDGRGPHRGDLCVAGPRTPIVRLRVVAGLPRAPRSLPRGLDDGRPRRPRHGHPVPVLGSQGACRVRLDLIFATHLRRSPRVLCSFFLVPTSSVRMPVLYLREEEVQAIFSMADALTGVEQAFRALGTGEAKNEPRRRIQLPHSMLNVMPAGWAARGYLGFKYYTVGSQGIRFWVHLVDAN